MKIIRLISPEHVYNIRDCRYICINENNILYNYLNVLQADNLVCKCVEKKETIEKNN